MKPLLFLITALLLSSCGGGFETQASSSSIDNSSGSSLSIFFSNPDDSQAGQYKNGPEKHLLAAINQAGSSIDMAIYELSLANITQGLKNAHDRGVQVRVLTDTDHLQWDSFQELINAGVSVKGDGRSALMHNKFTVIDNAEVWTGSMNLTYYGAYRHNENLIKLDSPQAAQNYSEEFLQLWRGVHNQVNAANNYFSINEIPVDIHFSPDDNFRNTRLLPLLRQATQSVHMMAFAFTSHDIANELVNLNTAGVDVRIAVDKGQSTQRSSQYSRLLNQHINILRDGNSYKLHHKVIIIDQRYVITGSYNFTQSAENRNDENSIVIDSPAIAQLFEGEFRKVFSQGF